MLRTCSVCFKHSGLSIIRYWELSSSSSSSSTMWNRIRLEMLMLITQLFYGTAEFLTVFTGTRYWLLSHINPLHTLQVRLFPSGFLTKTSYIFLILMQFFRKPCATFPNMTVLFYDKWPLAPRWTSNMLEGHTFQAVRVCLWSVFAVSWMPVSLLRSQPEDVSCRSESSNYCCYCIHSVKTWTTDVPCTRVYPKVSGLSP